MNRKIFNAIIIVLCSAFVITIAATSALLYSDYKTGVKAAGTRFEKLFKTTEDTIAKTSVPDKQFMETFKNAIGSSEYYYSINLKSGSQDIYLMTEEPQTSSKLFTVTHSRRITEGTTVDLTLTVVMYAIPTSMVYSRVRIAFLITLAITIISAFCLVYTYILSKNSKSKKSVEEDTETDEDEDFSFNDDEKLDLDLPESDEDFEFPENDDADISFNDNNITETVITTEDTQTASKPAYDFATSYVDPDAETETASEEISFDEPVIETDFNEPVPDINFDEPVIEETVSDEPVIQETVIEVPSSNQPEVNTDSSAASTDSDSSLFSTKTGFCGEKFLVTRLESELSRASSSELDVSLILIKIPGVNFEEPYGISSCNQILNIFHYRDIIFEYKNDGIAIIFNGADIDKAMETSEQIYAELCSTLSESGKDLKPVIGIASRTLRFISGERLIIEAEQALIHAGEDSESPIIAFRVNPEKYRKFMATKN